MTLTPSAYHHRLVVLTLTSATMPRDRIRTPKPERLKFVNCKTAPFKLDMNNRSRRTAAPLLETADGPSALASATGNPN